MNTKEKILKIIEEEIKILEKEINEIGEHNKKIKKEKCSNFYKSYIEDYDMVIQRNLLIKLKERIKKEITINIIEEGV